jgi:hypothetical protein
VVKVATDFHFEIADLLRSSSAKLTWKDRATNHEAGYETEDRPMAVVKNRDSLRNGITVSFRRLIYGMALLRIVLLSSRAVRTSKADCKIGAPRILIAWENNSHTDDS